MATLYEKLLSKLQAPSAPSAFSDPQVSADPLALLPSESRQKVAGLTDARDAARAVLRSRTHTWMEALTECGRTEARVAEAKRSMPQPPRGVSIAEMETAFDAELAKPKAALDKAIEAHQRAEAAARAFDFLSSAETWLTRYAALGGRLEHAPLPKPTLGVPAIRAKLAQLDRAWSEAENAPAPRDDYKARALAEVNALADAGRITIDMRNRGPNPLGVKSRLAPTLNRLALAPVQAGGPPDVHYALFGADECAAFLAWLHRDALIERISKEIDNADDVGALSHEARETRFAKLTDQKLALEFSEEAAIVAAANTGQTIARRRDADPRAILEVKEV